MKASCLNCRMFRGLECQLGKELEEGKLLCDAYEMHPSFLEDVMKDIRGDYLTSVTIYPDE